jgi:hypothetical protein
MSDKIKTVTHDGQVYQIGENYLFSDDGTDFSLAKLVRIKKNDWPFGTDDGDVYRYIHEVSALKNIGTITPAPIELVDGAAYMFDYDGRKIDRVGVYDELSSRFYFPIGHSPASFCTNIRPMTVESK